MEELRMCLSLSFSVAAIYYYLKKETHEMTYCLGFSLIVSN